MKYLFNRRFLFLTIYFLFLEISCLSAQIVEDFYRSNTIVDTSHIGNLFVEVNSVSFFKNNEFEGDFLKGYTLPGFWLQPKAVYYPLQAVKLEAGLHLLRFWGADKYPNYAYSDIANWKADDYQFGFHLLPYLRAQAALSKNITVVIGNIYGGSNHRLIEPLYNPELNLIADPEAGLQFLYQSNVVDMDIWINWESFIFNLDGHQEAFTAGLSSRINYNRPESKVHWYTPVQLLAQHRGGEIDTIQKNSVQTLMNGSVGIGAIWNLQHALFKSVNLELDMLGYYQQAGDLWAFDHGYGLYARASTDIRDFRLKTAYWQCEDFISILGSPFYGAVSMSEDNVTFIRPRMLIVGLEYVKNFGKGYSLGVEVESYQHFPVDMNTPEGVQKREHGMSFSAGVYFRLSPSFLLKRF